MPEPEKPGRRSPPRKLSRKLGWFVLLWVGGVVTVAAVAYGLRLLIAP